MNVVLGSSSKYRKAFLENAGFSVETISPDIDEKAIRSSDPDALVLAIAHAKMDAVLPKVVGEKIVITGDQVCVCDGEILEKPESAEEVRRRYKLFAEHPVVCVNGIVVTNVFTGVRIAGIMRTTVYFKSVPDVVVEKMIERGNVFHCAGGFLAEDDLTIPFIERIVGGIDGTAGMPIAFTKSLIEQIA